MTVSKREWWDIEFEEMVPDSIQQATFSTDTEALEYVARLRALNDPAFTPMELLHHMETTEVIEVVERTSLTVSADEVLELVKKRLLALKGAPPDGEDALSWAVRTTLEVSGG